MCPINVQWLKPTQVTMKSLWAFSFLDNNVIMNGLKAELPIYMAAAEDELQFQWYGGMIIKKFSLGYSSETSPIKFNYHPLQPRVFLLLKSSCNEE